jgi:SPP1 gp7 family putative phage head morphogenesis protein
MPVKQLRPIVDKKIYSIEVEQDMLQQLYTTIFAPLFEILGVKTPSRVNSTKDLRDEFRSGRIFWMEGFVYGKFSSVVAKALREMGASFNKTKKAYKLDVNKLPMDIKTDIVIGKGMNRDKTERILDALEKAKQLKLIVGTGMQATTMFDDLNQQAITTFKVLPENIQIPMQLTDRQKANILKDYTNNINLYINDWKQEAIERLREKTQKNAALGYRADRLANIIKSEFGVSKNKAKFLARQETGLFVSKYREERYTNAGIKEYIWSCSLDERVRPDHKALHHTKWSWDSPPIVDRSSGRRGNPGEDFGCRCLALPVVKLGAN